MYKIAASTRFILAMFRLIASVQSDLGNSLLSLIEPYFPGQIKPEDRVGEGKANPARIGGRMLAVARKEVQGNDDRARDLLGDWLTYMVGRKQDFSKDFATWDKAVDACMTNIRRRGISESQGHIKKRRKEESLTKGGKDGDAPSGEETSLPTKGALGRALDDQVAIKQFVELLDEHMGDLRTSLPENEQKLFDLIFEDNVGSFASDIKDNMNQASAMKEKYPDLFKANEKRWSGFIGDLRKKLLNSIWNYIDKHMTQEEYRILKETFYGDVDPSYVRRKENEKVTERLDYQQGLDERKISRWKWEEENGKFDESERKSFDNLKKKLETAGVNTNAILAEEKPKIENWRIQKVKKSHAAANIFEQFALASRVASSNFVPEWLI
jgi:hypothetical protein